MQSASNDRRGTILSYTAMVRFRAERAMNVTPTTALVSVATVSGAAAPPAWQAGERLTAIVQAQHGPQSLTLRIGGRFAAGAARFGPGAGTEIRTRGPH